MAIPRKIIQGWVGPKPMSPELQEYTRDMKRMNPDFEYIFFGNEALEKYASDFYVKHMISREEKWAYVMDRLRLLYLREHGGIWIDTDSKPVKPLSTLTFWDRHWDFVTAHRSAYRDGVQVKRGVPVVDNTVMASIPNGRMVNKLLNLYDSRVPVRHGAHCGWEMIEHSDQDVFWAKPAIFYSMGPHPEAVILHDDRNLGSWSDRPILKFAKQ